MKTAIEIDQDLAHDAIAIYRSLSPQGRSWLFWVIKENLESGAAAPTEDAVVAVETYVTENPGVSRATIAKAFDLTPAKATATLDKIRTTRKTIYVDGGRWFPLTAPRKRITVLAAIEAVFTEVNGPMRVREAFERVCVIRPETKRASFDTGMSHARTGGLIVAHDTGIDGVRYVLAQKKEANMAP